VKTDKRISLSRTVATRERQRLLLRHYQRFRYAIGGEPAQLLGRFHSVDEHDPIQMIDLVLKDARRKPLNLSRMGRPFTVWAST